MNAGDLPPDMKRQFLAQLEQKLGREKYRQLVGQLGEDGLIDMVLAHSPPSSSPPEPKKKGSWLGSVATVVVLILLLAVCVWSPEMGNVLYVLGMCVWGLVLFAGWLYRLSQGDSEAAEGCWVGLVVAVLLAVGGVVALVGWLFFGWFQGVPPPNP